jgi:hypothetical protein
VEVLKYDRSLWDTVQQTVVEQPRDARDNVLISPVGTAPEGTKSHTGHGVPERVETGTRAIGEGVRPNVSTDTGHLNNEKAAVTNVFSSEISGGYQSVVPWKPSMTEAEAGIYTSKSYYKDKVFYHGTNRNGANSIASEGINSGMFDEFSTYGPGFYVGNDQNIARSYAKRKYEETGQQGAVLGVRLKVKNPKVFVSGNDYHRAAADFIRQSGKLTEEWNIAFNNYLRKQGYDAIELSGLGYTIVFEKEQAVVISNEVVK